MNESAHRLGLLATACCWLVAGCAGPVPRPAPQAGRQPAGAASAARAGAVPAAKPRAASEPVVARGTVKEIDLGAFFALREAGKAVVYDVRPGLFYRMGHIAGAIGFSGKAFDDRFPQERAAMDAARAAGKEIVLYCTNVKCPDGRVVAGWLADRGYPVLVYTGGWEEWKEAGLPVE